MVREDKKVSAAIPPSRHATHENLNITVPDFVYSYVPHTLFLNNSNLSLNTAVVPQSAQPTPSLGINTVWVSSMGQFATMTVDKRNLLVKAWIDADNKYNLNFYVVYQMGSRVLSDSLKWHVMQMKLVHPQLHHSMKCQILG